MREGYLKVAAVMAMLSASLPGAAQNAPVTPDHAPSTAPQLRDSKACAQGPEATVGQGTRTDRGAPGASGSGATTLSDKLAQDRWCHLPSQHGSRHQGPDPTRRSDAGHSSARHPRRGSKRATQVKIASPRRKNMGE
jgi:hypothetical protein